MIKQGTKFQTNYGLVTVLKDEGWDRVTVSFDDTGYTTITRRESLTKGSLKDPTKAVVYGVGYTGIGKYKATHKFAKIWLQMLRRCYSEELLDKRPTYQGCKVANKWHNMQDFCLWCEDNYVWGYELDKDIKSLGGQIYSEGTCLFVPKGINTVITSVLDKKNCGLVVKGDKIYLYVTEEGKQTYFGSFSDKAAAREAYLKEKRRVVLNKTQDPILKNHLNFFFDWIKEN